MYLGTNGLDFTTSPMNPTLSRIGTNVTLAWTFSYSKPFSLIKIQRVSEDNVPTGTIVIALPYTPAIIVGKLIYGSHYSEAVYCNALTKVQPQISASLNNRPNLKFRQL